MSEGIKNSQSILKYVLLAFFSLQKKGNAQTEFDFVFLFFQEVQDNKDFFYFFYFDSEVVAEVFQNVHEVCYLESLLFLPDDLRFYYQEQKQRMHKNIQKIVAQLKENNLFLLQLNETKTRLFASFLSVFFEWCHDICFFSSSDTEKEKLLLESPLFSLYFFYKKDNDDHP